VLLKLRDNLDAIEYRYMVQQVEYLTSPLQMGDVFKVIAFSKDIQLNSYMGFNYNNL